MTEAAPIPSAGSPPVSTSVTTILFGPDPDRAAEALADALRKEGVEEVVGAKVSRLSALGRRTVIERVAAAMTPLLGVHLDRVLNDAWAKHDDLRAAGARTVASPGSTDVVELASHTATSTLRPSVDVRLDGVPVTRIQARVFVAITVEGMLGLVTGGRLVEIRSGRGTADIRLSVAGAEVAQREVVLDLPGVVELGDGIPLTDEQFPLAGEGAG